MISLDVGAGPSSDADFQIDQFWWPRTTHVFDIVNTPWPFEDEKFDLVRMEQVLEHIPTVVYYKEDGQFKHIYPRVDILREIHRILRGGGIVRISVPAEIPQWSQDPTHTGPLPTEGFLNYFCHQWGGNEIGSFTYHGYGINFEFKKVNEFRTGPTLTVELQKP